MAGTTTATATDIQEVEVVAVAVESSSSLSLSLPNWNHRKMTYETVLGRAKKIPQIDVMFPYHIICKVIILCYSIKVRYIAKFVWKQNRFTIVVLVSSFTIRVGWRS
jgi:hypothetical protein